jgi:hypothetical protein
VRGHKRPTATASFSGSLTLVQRIQAAGGLLRTNIPMRSTILRIALTNKKQVRAGGRGGLDYARGAFQRRRLLVPPTQPLHAARAQPPPPTPQVLIPDVQKLINQLGAINTDLFASRHVRPPTSVLLLPLRASGVGIYGALYCLSDVQVGTVVPFQAVSHHFI